MRVVTEPGSFPYVIYSKTELNPGLSTGGSQVQPTYIPVGRARVA